MGFVYDLVFLAEQTTIINRAASEHVEVAGDHQMSGTWRHLEGWDKRSTLEGEAFHETGTIWMFN